MTTKTASGCFSFNFFPAIFSNRLKFRRKKGGFLRSCKQDWKALIYSLLHSMGNKPRIRSVNIFN